MSFPILTLLVLVPAIGSALVALLSNRQPDVVKIVSLLTSVLVGGLGLGFTLRALLRGLPADGVVTVVELVPAIVA